MTRVYQCMLVAMMLYMGLVSEGGRADWWVSAAFSALAGALILILDQLHEIRKKL